MRYLDCTTKVGGLEDFGYPEGKYPVRVQQWETLEENIAASGKCDVGEIIIEAPQGAKETANGRLNAAQKQAATQGGKGSIREAMTRDLKDGEDRQEIVDEAVEAHKVSVEKIIQGAPRGSAGGITKTKAANLGKALKEKLGDEALAAMAAEYGLDISDL